MADSRQLRFIPALVLSLALTGAGLFYAVWIGYGGRALAFTAIGFALLLAREILPAAVNVTENLQRTFPAPIAWLLVLPTLGAYACYVFGTGSSTPVRWLVAFAYLLTPLALVSLGEGAEPGWYDYAALVAIAVPVKLKWLVMLWPYPDGKLAHTMSILFGVNVAITAFMLIRRMSGIGYAFAWAKKQTVTICIGIAVMMIVAIPVGLALHFLHWAPGHAGWASLPLVTLGIFFFTAWPEEFVFRGLLQNMLSRTLKNQSAGWIVASVLFGLSHIANGFFPNWKYALLATFAGFVYGWTWRKAGNIFAPSILHCVVDAVWHALFV
jgi:membrane protease YdiL (CAAX protease family)